MRDLWVMLNCINRCSHHIITCLVQTTIHLLHIAAHIWSQLLQEGLWKTILMIDASMEYKNSVSFCVLWGYCLFSRPSLTEEGLLQLRSLTLSLILTLCSKYYISLIVLSYMVELSYSGPQIYWAILIWLGVTVGHSNKTESGSIVKI